MNKFLMSLQTMAGKLMGGTSIPEADKSDLSSIAAFFKKLMSDILAPVLIVIGAAAAIYAVYLGVMYAKAEDGNKRKDVQGRLIGAAIGVVIIIVGITLCYAVQWDKIVFSMMGSK